MLNFAQSLQSAWETSPYVCGVRSLWWGCPSSSSVNRTAVIEYDSLSFLPLSCHAHPLTHLSLPFSSLSLSFLSVYLSHAITHAHTQSLACFISFSFSFALSFYLSHTYSISMFPSLSLSLCASHSLPPSLPLFPSQAVMLIW